jgi:hypothetical protein
VSTSDDFDRAIEASHHAIDRIARGIRTASSTYTAAPKMSPWLIRSTRLSEDGWRSRMPDDEPQRAIAMAGQSALTTSPNA